MIKYKFGNYREKEIEKSTSLVNVIDEERSGLKVLEFLGDRDMANLK